MHFKHCKQCGEIGHHYGKRSKKCCKCVNMTETYNCLICGKEDTKYISFNKKYCSSSCRTKAQALSKDERRKRHYTA